MRKFKKGDRVRGVAGRGGLGISKIVGLEGTIINYPSDTSIICVEFDKPFAEGHDGNSYGRGKNNHCFNLNEVDLELIDDEIELKSKKKEKKSNRFKAGDRVKFIGSSKSEAKHKLGTVKFVYPLHEHNNHISYAVEFDDDIDGHYCSCATGTTIKDGHGWNCDEHELERVYTTTPVKKISYQKSPAQRMNFQEGDEVICIKYTSNTMKCPYIGEVGKVIHVRDDITTVKFTGGVWGFDNRYVGDLHFSAHSMLKPIIVDFEVKIHHEDYQDRVISKMRSFYGDEVFIDNSLLLLL